MEHLKTLEDALKEELRDIYSAETQIIKALPKMVKKCASEELKEALMSHLQETENQVSRLDRVGEILGFKMSGKTCQGMKGLLVEGEEVFRQKNDDESLTDLLIIGAGQRVEHYEIAAYGTARAMAEALGHGEVARLLQQSIEEEGRADKKLTMIAEETILPMCSSMELKEIEQGNGAGLRRKHGKRGEENRGTHSSR